jgi:hypothetical protein
MIEENTNTHLILLGERNIEDAFVFIAIKNTTRRKEIHVRSLKRKFLLVRLSNL